MSQGFTTEQLKVAQALACGDTQKDAGRKAGVSRSSVIRWMKLPAFRQKVQELTEQYHLTQDETFIEAARESVEEAVTPKELVGYFTSILRDEDVRIADRLKAGQCLGRWMGLEDGALNQQVDVPELPLEPFAEAELCQRLDLLKSQAVVASQFLMQQALQKAAIGETQEAVMVMYRALDLADQCIDDLPQAANILSKKGFGVLSKFEYLKLIKQNPPDDSSSPAFDRLFSWTYQKHQKRR
jgi:hypothetical protein